MLAKIKSHILLILVLVTAGIVLSPQPASAQLFDDSKKEACRALNTTNSTVVEGESDASCGDRSGDRVNRVIEPVLNILSIVIGIVAVVMVIIAGLKYITSQGDSAGVSSAKNTLLYAIIGIVVVVSAQLIVKFVLQRTDLSPSDETTTQKTGAN